MTKATWQFEHTVVCKANKSFAWSFWTDVSNWERIEGKAVEWIKLEGPFAEGSTGATKMPGQAAQNWEIIEVEEEQTATIKMPLEGARFYNKMTFQVQSSDQTLIIQTLSLTGPKAAEFAIGMQTFEENAPLGLAKLARTIEAAYEAEA